MLCSLRKQEFLRGGRQRKEDQRSSLRNKTNGVHRLKKKFRTIRLKDVEVIGIDEFHKGSLRLKVSISVKRPKSPKKELFKGIQQENHGIKDRKKEKQESRPVI